ncbi:hypothetical protein C7H09_02075 [Marinobacter fuscus]|uniref:Uncharacterized protein n=1 Tax=Marinobacter fuscus TaxID=2109942 RepID=A0A2T1KTK7_9GAMM|nr:hypothetical protein [Marinobacter fuscus]PSF13421.1 hypothetical protein C7H09_02075 [Marinobacter fuscus]
MNCYKNGDFQKYFKENMDALGLPSPSTWFEATTTALGAAGTSIGLVEKFGAQAGLRTLIGATFAGEKIVLASGLLFVGYAGAAVGSAAVAAGRSLGCGTRMIDVISYIERNNLQFKGYKEFYIRHPEVYDTNHSNRKSFVVKARHQPKLFEYT